MYASQNRRSLPPAPRVRGRRANDVFAALSRRQEPTPTAPSEPPTVSVIVNVDLDGKVLSTVTVVPAELQPLPSLVPDVVSPILDVTDSAVSDILPAVPSVPAVPAVPAFPSALTVPAVPIPSAVALPTVPDVPPFPFSLPIESLVLSTAAVAPGPPPASASSAVESNVVSSAAAAPTETSPPPSGTSAADSTSNPSGNCKSKPSFHRLVYDPNTFVAASAETAAITSATQSAEPSSPTSGSETPLISQSDSSATATASLPADASKTGSFATGTLAAASSTAGYLSPPGPSPPPSGDASSVGGGDEGGGGGGGGGDDDGAGPTTPQIVGGVVGGVAGIAVVLLLALVLLRWYRRRQNKMERLSEPEANEADPFRDPDPPMQQKSRGGSNFLPPAASLLLNRLSGATRSSTYSTPSEHERSFQRVSGRKLPSAFSAGMTSDDMAGHGRDSRVYGGSPFEKERGPPTTAGTAATGGAYSSSPSYRPTTKETLMPSPARTPVVHHSASYSIAGTASTRGGHDSSSHLSPPQSPKLAGTLGRSHPSMDGSRGSRFTEDV